jgi:hypothetical protein
VHTYSGVSVSIDMAGWFVHDIFEIVLDPSGAAGEPLDREKLVEAIRRVASP